MVTIEKLVDEIRALRLSRDQADARLLLRLVEIERDHMDVIAAGGCASFAQFIKGLTSSVVDPARYDRFKIGLAKVGVEEALAIGSEATVVAGQLTNGPQQYTTAIRAWVTEHRGTLPSQETAKHILLQVDPRPEQPQALRRQDELSQLRARVQQLESENRALKRKLAKLEGGSKAA